MGFAPAVTGRASLAIRRSADIRRVLSEGRRVSGRLVGVHILPSPDQTRVGFASSRAVGGAVVRNRARRLLREAWRVLEPRTAGAHWIMLVARPPMAGAGLADVLDDLEASLASGGVIE
jgi:ribonuclease P protein component